MVKITQKAVVLFALLVVIGVSIIFIAAPAPVSAYVWIGRDQMNVHEHNGTGRVANDLEVFLDGNALISNWWGGPFQSFSYGYDSSTNTTTLRWYNGTVNNCQYADTCLSIENSAGNITNKYLPRWSYDGVAGPIVGAALSHDFKLTAPDLADVTFANTPKDGGPETIGIIQVGTTNTVYTLPELLWTNEALNKIPWIVQKTNIPLKLGQSITFPSIPVNAQAKNIIYRAKIWLDSDPKNIIEYVGQFVPISTETPQQ